MHDENPYAAPQSDLSVPVELADEQPLASRSRRFFNYLIDSFAVQILQYGFGYALAAVAIDEGVLSGFSTVEVQLVGMFLGILLVLGYYVVLEAATGRTIGKVVTGTRVVDEAGGPASFGQILGRTLCRLIPFEAFSFLGQRAVGWHDSIPKTRVVRVR